MKIIFLVALILGGALALFGVIDTLYYLNNEPLAYSLRRGVPSLALLSLTVAYLVVLLRKGYWFGSVLLYSLSYVGLGAVLSVSLVLMTKGFAPTDPSEVVELYWMYGGIMVLGVLASVLAFLFNFVKCKISVV